MSDRGMVLVFALVMVSLTLLQVCCERTEPPSMVLSNGSSPPCWFDICPGNAKAAAAESLGKIPHIDSSTITDHPTGRERGYISWTFAQTVADYGRLYYVDDQLAQIQVFPRPRGSLSLGEITAQYGEPGYLWAYSDCADSRWLYVSLIYSDLGLYVVYFDDRWETDEPSEITPDLGVNKVVYYNPESLEDLMVRFEGANWIGADYTFDEILSLLQPWQGFGEIPVFMQCH